MFEDTSGSPLRSPKSLNCPMNIPQTSYDDLPLITHESLPKSPGLFDTYNENGDVIDFRVLAFPLRRHDAFQWAENNKIGVDKLPHMRRKMALPAILRLLPPDCRRIAIVPVIEHVGAYSVVVATNETAEDLARADDLEMLRLVQRVMGISQLPAWYIPRQP